MNKTDLPQLEARLRELSEALSGKAPTVAALKVWLDALQECPADDVWWVLTDWPKSHAKAPLPAEVLKLCRERMSLRVEKAAEVYSRDDRRPWSPAAIPANTEIARRELAKIKSILASKKAHPKAWAPRVLKAPRCDYAAMLARKVADPVETPEEMEARLEREAIQAEAA